MKEDYNIRRKNDWMQLPRGSDYHGNGKYYGKYYSKFNKSNELKWNEWPKLPSVKRENKNEI